MLRWQSPRHALLNSECICSGTKSRFPVGLTTGEREALIILGDLTYKDDPESCNGAYQQENALQLECR